MTKRPQKPIIRRGTVRRLTGGEIAMDFVAEFIDNGAPEFYVTGLASIERINASQIRFTKYSRRRDGNIVTHHEVWDFETWKRSFANYEQALTVIERLPAGDGPGEQRKGRH